MKKILLLSYYYPPYTGIEGNRASSWANYLSSNGFQVTVITRQWKADGQNKWEDYFSEYFESELTVSKLGTLTVKRLPYYGGERYKRIKRLPLTSLQYWWFKARGHFHIETDAHYSLETAAITELEQSKYDFLIVTSPPLNIIRLGVELKNKFNIPLIADFRDSYNNHLLNPKYKPSLKEKFENLIFKNRLKRWLAMTDIVVSVSEAVLKTLPLNLNQRQVIVMNGYEEDSINNDLANSSSKFILSLVGNIYASQEIELMSRGFAHFIEKEKPHDLEIRFIGLSSHTEVRKRIENNINKKYLFFTKRVSRKEALRYMHTSNILFQVGWLGYKGYCPGKVFEYLAAKRNILIAPGDGDLTDKVVSDTKSGISVFSEEEMADYLSEKYKEWKTNGRLSYFGDELAIKQYSRKTQNQNLVDVLNRFKTQ